MAEAHDRVTPVIPTTPVSDAAATRPVRVGPPIPLQRQVLFWLGALLAFGLAIYAFSGILLPFVAGLVLAYFLDPLADRLERLGMSRLWATVVILGLFVTIFVVALLVAIPLLVSSMADFLALVPDYAAKLQRFIMQRGHPLFERFGANFDPPDLSSSIGDFVSKGAAWFGEFAKSLWSGSQSVLNVLSLIVVTPVVAFYLLVDWDHMIAKVDGWIPPRHRGTVRGLATEVNGAISGFIRGQALVCLILGSWYAIGLWLTGLNFGFLIGMIAGFLTFIPYVGSLTGLVLSAGVALVQFWPDWIMISAVLGIFFTGQFVEGNILSPKLVGEAVGLHPVWLMFALFAFGSMFGFVGLLLAVPMAATAGVLARFALRQYLASPLYEGGTLQLPGPQSDG